jgi:hypothetical protein
MVRLDRKTSSTYLMTMRQTASGAAQDPVDNRRLTLAERRPSIRTRDELR